MEEDPPPRSGHGRGTPPEVVTEEDPPEVVMEEDPPHPEVVVEVDPQKWWWKWTPPQGKDQTRPFEKYCWVSGRYALEKKASLCSMVRGPKSMKSYC